MLENLKKYRIILASNSPRRQELLSLMDVKFDSIVRKGVDENYPKGLKTKDVPEYLARKKAEAYKDLLADPNTLIITADTIVILDKEIIGKPQNQEGAKELLMKLQGRSHRVISGVAITTAEKQVSFSVKTKVLMRPMDEDIINYYVKHYKPTDKAGAYGIQEWIGAIGIGHIEGSFQNVMGLPTQRLFVELCNF
ncbi:MAG: Maf family nucleotide pyrophosphatase [Marinilabiliaceae bacterium]|jgi:septum formation protein|nr:septum formation protein Maf [Bacteroidales bacterium]MCR5695340.1 Maf family nucleotide pyrophosphatase [Marinilabiliaceae bacterium]